MEVELRIGVDHSRPCGIEPIWVLDVLRVHHHAPPGLGKLFWTGFPEGHPCFLMHGCRLVPGTLPTCDSRQVLALLISLGVVALRISLGAVMLLFAPSL